MVIHIQACATGQPIYLALLTDIYGDTQYTDSAGNTQIAPGFEGNLINTLISVSASGFITGEFTITSLGVNTFCLNAPTTTGTGTGTGGIY
jgi:hypothetical protein